MFTTLQVNLPIDQVFVEYWLHCLQYKFVYLNLIET